MIKYEDLAAGYSYHFDKMAYFVRNYKPKTLKTIAFENYSFNREDLYKFMIENGFTVLHSKEDSEDDFDKDLETKSSISEYFNKDKEKTIVEVHYKSNNLYIVYEDKLNENLLKYVQSRKIEEVKKGYIHFLASTSNRFYLIDLANRNVDIDLDNNYQCNYSLKKLPDILSQEGSGLLLLSSKIPGTGKSYLIRHLCNSINKKFVFLTNESLARIADPAFIPFALENLKDSILIAEDAEHCLIDRNKQFNDAASTLLNLTDGLLADVLGIKIVCTVNNEEMIDKALLRKGRLIAKIDFDKLSIEKSNKFLKNRGLEMKVSEPHSLADLYNVEQETTVEIKAPIGFKLN